MHICEDTQVLERCIPQCVWLYTLVLEHCRHQHRQGQGKCILALNLAGSGTLHAVSMRACMYMCAHARARVFTRVSFFWRTYVCGYAGTPACTCVCWPHGNMRACRNHFAQQAFSRTSLVVTTVFGIVRLGSGALRLMDVDLMSREHMAQQRMTQDSMVPECG